jgi:hypothetical protein
VSEKYFLGAMSVFLDSMVEEKDYVVLFRDGYVLLDIDLVFQSFGNLLCMGSVQEGCC